MGGLPLPWGLEDYFKVISKKALCEGGAFDVVFYYGVPILTESAACWFQCAEAVACCGFLVSSVVGEGLAG